ncbi:MAG: hypothetical protein HZC02_03705 [Candidatus Levybacteria bacterium]|nr:hypothetical protein [Candidatus Levybacteria bacterium]
MSALFFYPFYVLRFWYGEGPVVVLKHFYIFNRVFLDFFSVKILLKTFFLPVKNEYRDGLVGFSIGIGIFMKSCLLIIAAFLFMILLVFEVVIFGGYMAFPLITVGLLLW